MPVSQSLFSLSLSLSLSLFLSLSLSHSLTLYLSRLFQQCVPVYIYCQLHFQLRMYMYRYPLSYNLATCFSIPSLSLPFPLSLFLSLLFSNPLSVCILPSLSSISLPPFLLLSYTQLSCVIFCLSVPFLFLFHSLFLSFSFFISFFFSLFFSHSLLQEYVVKICCPLSILVAGLQT